MTQDRIRVLDDTVAQKIAAGEVVNRPASVIKELVENAIDAGSTALSVEAAGGGQEYLRVADNGGGIHADDVRLAFMRHATSKIHTASDLFSVRSMGFRGEALYSIAAVSRLELITRTAGGELGVRIDMEGGRETRFEPAGCPRGTSVTVRDLFFNTPARRKFMSRPAVETGYIGALMVKMILSRPEVSMKFVCNGKTIYHSPGDGNPLSAMITAYGRETAARMTPVEGEAGAVRVRGFVGDSETFRGNRNGQAIFVNGRMIESLPLSRAVERVYGPLLMVRKYPSFVLHLTVPPESLDVNVHPQKTTVRFADEREAQEAVSRAAAPALSAMLGAPRPMLREQEETVESGLSRALDRLAALPSGAPSGGDSREAERKTFLFSPRPGRSPVSDPKDEKTPDEIDEPSGSDGAGRQAVPERRGDVREALWDLREQVREIIPERGFDYRAALHARKPVSQEDATLRNRPQEPLLAGSDPGDLPAYRLAGVLFRTYAVVEAGDQVWIVDQHAAHERLLYERFMEALSGRRTLSQQLLIPQILEITHDEMSFIGEHMDAFRELGFVLEEYGRLSYQVRAVPVIMGQASVKAFFLEALDLLRDRQAADSGSCRDRIIELACKKAVKAGDALDEREIRAILDLIGREGVPLTCPHGRPLVLSLPRRELERKFKRLV